MLSGRRCLSSFRLDRRRSSLHRIFASSVLRFSVGAQLLRASHLLRSADQNLVLTLRLTLADKAANDSQIPRRGLCPLRSRCQPCFVHSPTVLLSLRQPKLPSILQTLPVHRRQPKLPSTSRVGISSTLPAEACGVSLIGPVCRPWPKPPSTLRLWSVLRIVLRIVADLSSQRFPDHAIQTTLVAKLADGVLKGLRESHMRREPSARYATSFLISRLPHQRCEPLQFGATVLTLRRHSCCLHLCTRVVAAVGNSLPAHCLCRYLGSRRGHA